MKIKRKVAALLAGIMAVVSCGPMTSSAVNADPNGDGKLSIADTVFIQQYLLGCFEPSNLTALDVDNNGVISQMDAYQIQLYLAGYREESGIK